LCKKGLSHPTPLVRIKLEKTTNWRDEKWLNTILPLIPKFCTIFFKGVKDEGMTKLLESVLNQVLQAQAAEQIKAEPYERTEEREDYRNGYYKRRLETRVGI